ncbi:hypothetical protein ACC693_38260, partial [Rhizobium ruizarguesonis]
RQFVVSNGHARAACRRQIPIPVDWNIFVRGYAHHQGVAYLSTLCRRHHSLRAAFIEPMSTPHP